MSASIYFDNNSTTQMLPEVVTAMTECLRRGYVNPASQHGSGRAARRILEQARERIASMLGAVLEAPNQDQLIFTSGGTESNNLAIRGLVSQPGEILISSIEHPSALAAADELATIGYQIIKLPVSKSGHVSADLVESMISPRTRLVCLMMGNNEVGTLQPIKKVVENCSTRRIPLHVDAVQVVGKLSVNFRDLGATSLAFSAHKFHGPRGIGGLLLKSKTKLAPLLVGGSQQLGLRPGTESIASVVGMAKALELFFDDNESREVHLRRLREKLECRLITGCHCLVNGAEPLLSHTLNMSFPGLDRQALMMALDLAGVECATGSACTSGSSEPSHVLVAMGCKADVINSSIRFSLSALTTESEVDDGAGRILSVINNLRRKK